MSKGDVPRPMDVTREEFADRWERTFGAGSGEATTTGHEVLGRRVILDPDMPEDEIELRAPTGSVRITGVTP